jgi:alanine-glyoxylate transaminase/serine-glyoxylate transaminase/serine-pyruvate transaminase
VTAVTLPREINGAHVVDVAFRRYNLALGAGLAKVAGKVFRIGHLGDLNELMLLGALAGTEMAMADVGVKIEPGNGVGAAQAYWRRTDPVPKKRVARAEVVYASHSAGSINA